jgi:hypothetical protein
MSEGALPCPPRPYRLQYEGEIHVTIIATGFSQTFEDNLWGTKSAAVRSGTGIDHAVNGGLLAGNGASLGEARWRWRQEAVGGARAELG